MTPWRIAVLWHEHERHRDLTQYAVTHLAKLWRADGHDVRFLFGTDRYEPADVVFVHVNLSVVPERYLEFAARYPKAVNGRVRDIRRTAFSRNLVGPDDDYAGPVIVKSNANHAGRPERHLVSRSDALRSRVARKLGLQRLRDGAGPVIRSPLDYPIFDRVDDVPRAWFDRPDLVVERFLPERVADAYSVRYYLFLGDRSICFRLIGNHPIVDGRTHVSLEVVASDPEIEQLRHRLGFDYGKFDYVISNGRPVLLDTNKTMGAPTPPVPPVVVAWQRQQADGLYSYLTRDPAAA